MSNVTKRPAKNHVTEDRYYRNSDTLEEDHILAERARNEIPADCLSSDWLSNAEEDARQINEVFNEIINIKYPFFKDSSNTRYFPHGGIFKAYLTDKRHFFEFKRHNFRNDNIKQRNKDLFFTFIVDDKSKYHEQLSFDDVLSRVQENINKGMYKPGAGYLDHEARRLQEDIDYLGKRASLAFRKRHSDEMDLLVKRALRSMPMFFQSRKPGIILLRKHFEKRYAQMFHGTLKEKKDAACFIDSIYRNRGAYTQSDKIPECMYVSGLVHFLLPIARNMHDNYRKVLPKNTKVISTWDDNWKKRINKIDRRLISFVKNGTLPEFLANPRKHIEQKLLLDLFKLNNCETIKDRLKAERKA